MLLWLPVNVTGFGAATTVVKDVVEDVGGVVCLSTTWEDQQLDEDKVGDGGIKKKVLTVIADDALWVFPDHLLGMHVRKK
jgi:hypothetical protein